MFIKMLKILTIFAIFAAIMIVKSKGEKSYGKIILAVILPSLMEFVKLFDVFFRFNEIAYMMAQIVLWLLVYFVYVWSFLMIYKSTTNSHDGMVNIFKKDFKGWNVVVIVAIVLGVCSLVGHTWYMIKYGDEYSQMVMDAFYSSSFLDLMSGNLDFNTLYDRLVDLNVILKWVIIGCMVIPAVVHSEALEVAGEDSVD